MGAMKLRNWTSIFPWFLLWPAMAIASMIPVGIPRLAMKLALILPVVVWGAVNWKNPEKLFPLGRQWLPFSLSICVLTFLTGLGIFEFINYSGYFGGDFGIYLSTFHNSGWLLGREYLSGRQFLGLHSEFLCIPVGWIFKLAPWPVTIQLVQMACSLWAWALLRSWILKRSEDKVFGEWMALGFMLSPCLLANSLRGFYGVSVAIPFLVMAATAYHDGKWKKFLYSLCMLLLAKEIFAVTAICLGALALLQRRSLKWVVVPFALGLGVGMTLRFWYFPMMMKDSAYYFDQFVGDWKVVLARIVSLDTFLYLIRVALYGGSILVLRSQYSLLALPAMGPYIILGWLNIRSHYVLEPSLWLFFGAITVFFRTRENSVAEQPHRKRWLFSLLACMFFMSINLGQDLPFFRHHPFEKSYRQAVTVIPEDATLGLGVAMEDYLYKIHHYYYLEYERDPSKPPCTWSGEFKFKGGHGEYILLHKDIGSDFFAPENKERTRHCWAELEKDSTLQTVWQDSVLVLLKRN